VDEFGLERAEETLDHCIVQAVAPGAHAARDARLLERAAFVVARLLTAAIGAVDQIHDPGPMGECRGKRRQWSECARNPAARRAGMQFGMLIGSFQALQHGAT
jgi:hypothetical protein